MWHILNRSGCSRSQAVHNKFSVKYYLNLVLVDEEDRRYFKQQEITLWRKNVAAAGAAQ